MAGSRKVKKPDNPTALRRLTMNAFVSALYRDLACAAASALITLIVAVSFVQSTSVPPGAAAARHATVTVEAEQA
jgi:hypothetical protein